LSDALHGGSNPRMYGMLIANAPGCVAFSLPVQAVELGFGVSSVFRPLLPVPAQARGPQEGSGSSPSGIRWPVPSFGCRSDEAMHLDTGPRRGPQVISRARSERQHLTLNTRLSATRDKAAPSAASMFQTGRRLMRQILLPIKSHGQSAPERSDSSARRPRPQSFDLERRALLRFGLPLTPESGGPSRRPTALLALTAPRVRRRQEFQNAQQDVDRCHPPGRDPGRRGPRQSRRRI
jgi:hypothetical protein